MNKLIVITTAITRPEIHDLGFKNIKWIFKGLKVKWLINIDNFPYNDITQKQTKDNFTKLLKDFDVDYFISSKPCFFKGVKKLVLESEKYLDENTCILWLEDDWRINGKHTIKYFIDNYYTKYCYISLVYNNFGCFPPFIMGNELYKVLLNDFKNKEEKIIDPELFSINSLWNHVRKNNIKPFHFIFDYNITKKSKNNRIELINSVYGKKGRRQNKDNINYIVSNNDKMKQYIDWCLNTNKKRLFNNNGILLCQEKDYKNIVNINDVVIIHFGKFSDMYKKTYFVDIGTVWKRGYNLAKFKTGDAINY